MTGIDIFFLCVGRGFSSCVVTGSLSLVMLSVVEQRLLLSPEVASCQCVHRKYGSWNLVTKSGVTNGFVVVVTIFYHPFICDKKLLL